MATSTVQALHKKNCTIEMVIMIENNLHIQQKQQLTTVTKQPCTQTSMCVKICRHVHVNTVCMYICVPFNISMHVATASHTYILIACTIYINCQLFVLYINASDGILNSSYKLPLSQLYRHCTTQGILYYYVILHACSYNNRSPF